MSRTTSRRSSPLLVGVIFFVCLLIPWTLGPAEPVPSPFWVLAKCSENTRQHPFRDTGEITLRYTIDAKQSDSGSTHLGRLQVVATFTLNGVLVTRRLTGIEGPIRKKKKRKKGHNGGYRWLCNQKGTPQYLPLVILKLPKACAEKKTFKVEHSQQLESANFRPKDVLLFDPERPEASYLPKHWTGGPDCSPQLHTIGYSKARNGFLLMIEGQPKPVENPSQAAKDGGVKNVKATPGTDASRDAEGAMEEPSEPVKNLPQTAIDGKNGDTKDVKGTSDTPVFEIRIPDWLPDVQLQPTAKDCTLVRSRINDDNDRLVIRCSRRKTALTLVFNQEAFAPIAGGALTEVLKPKQLRPKVTKTLDGHPPDELWYCRQTCKNETSWQKAANEGYYFSPPPYEDWRYPIRVRLIWSSDFGRKFSLHDFSDLIKPESMRQDKLSDWGPRYSIDVALLKIDVRETDQLVAESCHARFRGTLLELACEERPEKGEILVGIKRQDQSDEALFLRLDLSNPQKPTVSAHTRLFYLKRTEIPPSRWLEPVSLHIGEDRIECSPIQGETDVFECRHISTSRELDPLHLEVAIGKHNAKVSVALEPGIRTPILEAISKDQIDLIPKLPKGKNPTDWDLKRYSDAGCGKASDTSSDVRSARLRNRTDPNRFSSCVPTDDPSLDIVDGKLGYPIQFSDFLRALPRPDDVPWKSDYQIRWQNPTNDCWAPKPQDPPGFLICRDIPRIPAKDWPSFEILDPQGKAIYSARLDLRRLATPELAEPRHILYLEGPDHLTPRLSGDAPCKMDIGSGLWRCPTPEPEVTKIGLSDAKGNSTSVELTDMPLEAGGVLDWIRQLPKLPLAWAGEGNFFLVFPPSHWQRLQIFANGGCSGIPQGFSMETLKEKGLGYARAKLGQGLRLLEPAQGRRTTCIPLGAQALRIGAQGLAIGFSTEIEAGKRRRDRRNLSIIDVSARMGSNQMELLKILRKYSPPNGTPATLGLMNDRLVVMADAETFDAGRFVADLDRLGFNYLPRDALRLIAGALEPFKGSTDHRLRIFLSRSWADVAPRDEYSALSMGYLNHLLEYQEILDPVDLFLIEGNRTDCDRLLDAWPPKQRKRRFRCTHLPLSRLSQKLAER